MDRSTQIKLISISYTTDALLQRVPVENERTIYADVQSVSRSEWNAAGQQGLKPEYELTVFGPDYQGEKIVAIQEGDSWPRFSVYRTYRGRNDELSLYVERRTGTKDPEEEPDDEQQGQTG